MCVCVCVCVCVNTQVKLQLAKMSLSWSRDGIFDHEVIHLFLKLVQEHKEAKVVSVAEKPRTKAPPHALHTVELLRMASSKLHIGPKQAMDMAERLYISVRIMVDHIPLFDDCIESTHAALSSTSLRLVFS